MVFCARHLMSPVLRLQKKFKILLFEQLVDSFQKNLFAIQQVSCTNFSLSILLWNAVFIINIIAVVYFQDGRPWKHLLTRHDSRHTLFLTNRRKYLPALGFVTHWCRLRPAPRREVPAIRFRLRQCLSWSFGHLHWRYFHRRLFARNFNQFQAFTHNLSNNYRNRRQKQNLRLRCLTICLCLQSTQIVQH